MSDERNFAHMSDYEHMKGVEETKRRKQEEDNSLLVEKGGYLVEEF